MSTVDRAHALDVAIALAAQAAEMVMRVYAEPFDVEYKAKDDPVTRADKEANAFLVRELARAFPGVPIVAEESDPSEYGAYREAEAAWFVDPLDGTREFCAKNGQFAVMIGLAENGQASLGVIACPGEGRSFAGIVGEGAFEIVGRARTPIHVSKGRAIANARVVVSRSHRAAVLDRVLAELGATTVTPTGSSGLKAARIATGEADVYLQPGRAGKRWDACATEALVRAAGGRMTDARGRAFDYRAASIENADGLVATNAELWGAAIAAIARATP